MKGESQLHQMVCDYLKLQYKGVIFRTDFAAGTKMSIGQATKHKRLQSDRAYPDLFIAEQNGEYAGMFIELKNDGIKTHKKDGTLVSNPHIREQARMLERLQAKGYYATFASGFNQAKEIIDEYLSDIKYTKLRSLVNEIHVEEGKDDSENHF